MSHGRGSSVIQLAVFLAILLIAVPVGAYNVTPARTTNVTTQTNVTTSPTANVTQAVNVTPLPTTVATPLATATPVDTTAAVTQPTTVFTTLQPTASATETMTTGSVNVYSSPNGASILIDSHYSGTTPKTVNGVAAGNHMLRLELSGYYDYEGSLYVVPGQTAVGYGTLQPVNQATPGIPAPVPTATVPVIVPVVTAIPVPTQDPGLLGNPAVIVAIIGAVTVLIVSGVSIYVHLTPPRKE
jgi:hypothetical protein